MNLQLVEIIVIFFLGLLMTALKENINTRKLYVVLIIAFLWFVGSMRSNKTGLDVGADTMNYCNEFYGIFDMSWAEIQQALLLRYYYGIGDYDIGYIFLVKLISILTDSWNVFSLIAQALFFIPFGILMYRFSKSIIHIMFAAVFYIALIQTFVLFGARQMYAVGLCMISFIYVLYNNYKKALFFVLIASTIHMSSLLFLGPVFLSKFRYTFIKQTYIVSFLLVLLVVTVGAAIVSLMGNLIGMDKYAAYSEYKGASGYTFFGLLELLSLFCFIALKKNILKKNGQLLKLYSILPFVTFFAGFITVHPSLQRTALYFYLYISILFPIAINSFLSKDSEKTIFHIVAIMLLSFFILKGGGLHYYFFWQESQFLM